MAHPTRRWLLNVCGATAAAAPLALAGASKAMPASTGLGVSTVMDYGAKGDGRTDDTDAFRRAVADTKTLYVPPGNYRISGAIDLRGANRLFRGLGAPGTVTITSTNTDQPILLIGASYCDMGNFQLQYEGQVKPTSIAIQIYGLCRSKLSNIMIRQCFRGINIPQEAGYSYGIKNYLDGSNFIYSVSLDTITILEYADAALSLMSYKGGSTGCVFTNIYTNSFDPRAKVHGRARVAVELGAFSESIFNQLNVEHTALDSAVQMRSDCYNIIMNSVHLEGYEAASSGHAVFELNGRTNLILNGLMLETCDFKRATLGDAPFALFRLGPNSTVELSAFSEYHNNVDVQNLVLAQGGASGTVGSISLRAAKFDRVQPRVISGPGGWAPGLLWPEGGR